MLRPFLQIYTVLGTALLCGSSLVPASLAEATYIRDVAPIFTAHCVECHRTGQIGPMPLASYEEIRPWAKSIRRTVANASMPPWHAREPRGVFANERVLSDVERNVILNWIDLGAPRGEGPDPPAPGAQSPLWRMGEPDQVFSVPHPFDVPDSLEDEYKTFRVPTELTEDKWVSGIEVRPGSFEVVHHVLIFLVPPGGGSFKGGEGDVFGNVILSLLDSRAGAGLFAKYAPGGHPEIWPEGRGRLLPAGSDLIFQVHYHKTPGPGTGRRDQSSLALKYAAQPARRPITTAWLINPIFRLEPNVPDTRATSRFLFLDDGVIYALAPHLHVRGTSFQFEARYPGGRRELLLDVPSWDFNWQTSYIFKEPKHIPRGTVIRAVAHWDNSAANPSNPDPGKAVTFGEATTEEMMIGFMDYSYLNAPELQAQIGLPGEIDEAVGRLIKDLHHKLKRGWIRSASARKSARLQNSQDAQP